MQGSLQLLPRRRRAASCPWRLLFLAVFIFARGDLLAAQLKEARVTQIVKDVKLLPGGAAPKPAAINDPVRDGTAVRTGVESRTELTFIDQTIARLGASTVLGLAARAPDLELKDGVVLVRAPHGSAKIKIAALAAELNGATAIFEFHPQSYLKVIALEGTGRLYLPDRVGESVLVHAGEMLLVRTDAKALPDPVDVDLRKIASTSLLINGFARPLGSENLIASEGVRQAEKKKGGQLFETNLAILGGGTAVSLLEENPEKASVRAGKAKANVSSSR